MIPTDNVFFNLRFSSILVCYIHSNHAVWYHRMLLSASTVLGSSYVLLSFIRLEEAVPFPRCFFKDLSYPQTLVLSICLIYACII